jgi:putative heme iron utilization protein
MAAPRSSSRRVRRRFLARHPKSELYAGFGDFSFWRMDAVSAHLNGGFARAADLSAADILTDLFDADELVGAEEGAVAHMNADHAEAVQLYAEKLLDARPGAWRVTGIDPDGVDLMLGDSGLRLPFPERIRTTAALRQALVRLAEEARAKG